MSNLKQGRSLIGSKHEILISIRELSEFILRECLSQGHSGVCKYEGQWKCPGPPGIAGVKPTELGAWSQS